MPLRNKRKMPTNKGGKLKKGLLFFLIIIVSACTQNNIVKEEKNLVEYYGYADRVLYELPPEWKNLEKRKEAIEYYKKYLEGKKIFIDPGHGGEDRRNASPTGKVIEADINLRVALYLRNYLEDAGANVIMLRESDKTVDLKERSVIANNSGADFFLSIHHNAPGSDNYWTNYTSTFYHARPENFEYEPCQQDMAKYIQRDLSYVMDNPGGLGSFDGTYSDYLIYPGSGFSVLRETDIPAVLTECSFFTNRLEEIRLQSEEFNEIQAWGIFKGFGKYFRAGIPKIEFDREKSTMRNDTLKLYYKLTDQFGIDPYSIQTFMDSTLHSNKFIESDSLVNISVANPPKGEHEIRIICKNINGNHSLPYHKKILVK